MTQPSPPRDLPTQKTNEVVAEFASKDAFKSAVARLLREGFERTDISVLASHDSLDLADEPAGTQTQHAAAVFGIELPWLAPLAVAEVLLAASGPIGLIVAGAVAAAAGVVALQPLLREVTENAHAKDFSAALKNGRTLLWVRVRDAATADRAERALAETGGTGIKRVTAAPMQG